MNGVARDLIIGQSVRDIIDMRAQQSPDAVYLVDPQSGRKLTFADCQARIQAVSGFIAKQGIKHGESVAYGCANSLDAVLAILGILYGGYLATAINLAAGDTVISYVLDHSETKLIFVDEKSHLQIGPLAEKCARTPRLINVHNMPQTGPAPTFNFPCSDSMDGLLMYTSGTTGRPKGVILTHKNLLSGGANVTEAHQLMAQDCGLCVLPLYHINAFCVSLMGTLVSGGSLVMPPRFSVSVFWEIIRSCKCSWFSVVPTQISYLLHNAGHPGCDATGCKQLRFGRSASAPLSPDMHKAFEKRFDIPVIETMGLTETAAQILSNPLPPGIAKIGSPGVGFGNEIIISDENENEKPQGEEGEVLVRGSNVMRCYLKNEEATKKAITPDRWLRTGDLGRMDEHGYVYITGRLKELIIKGGENIAPREIDDALYTHGDVVEAAAFACDCPNYGQRVEAGVVVNEGSTLTEAQLIALCEEKVGRFKAPDRVYFFPELPKGPSGKIQRIKLAELVKNMA